MHKVPLYYLVNKKGNKTMLDTLNKFLPFGQIKKINTMFTEGSVESVAMLERLKELEGRIEAMPETRETEGQGDKAIAHLRYSLGDYNFYIIEKDSLDEQHQAFAYVDHGNGMPELGYQSLIELQNSPTAELDLDWVPATLEELKLSAKAIH